MRPFDPALLRALPATRGPVAGLSVVGVVSGVVAIAQAVVLAVTVGRVVSGGPLTGLLWWLVGLLVLRGVLAGISEYVARWAGQRVSALVRLEVLRRWLGRPEESRPPTDVAVTRATEGVSALEPYVSRYLPALVTGVVVPALAIVTLLVVDPWSALIVVLTLPLLPVFAALIGLHTQDQTERRWGAMAQLAGHFLDVVRGLPTLVTYGRARAQVGVVREVGDRHRAATIQTLRTAFLSTAALELLATISVAMVAVAVGLRLAYGAMDLTVGLTAILLAPEAYWPVRRMGMEFHNAADGATTLEMLGEEGILDAEPSITTERRVWSSQRQPGVACGHPEGDRASLVDTRIRLDDVSYAHAGREHTLVDLTLSTPDAPGLTAVTGPSGAGKTTVLELLAGLRIPARGQVTAPGAHLASQRPVILPGTVRDNLLLAGSGHDDADLVEALERVGLWDALAAREGLDTGLGDDGFGLSAGQRARLALARAVLSDAPLLLLDEPTANVAAASVPVLHEVIRGLARERRVIVVTHDPALAALADDHWSVVPVPQPDLTPALARDAAPASGAGAISLCHMRRGTDACDTEEMHKDAPQGQPASREPGSATTTGSAPAAPTAGAATATASRPGVIGGRWALPLACLLGGLSVSAGVALTATSGWLIVQASTMPVILTLMVAIVGVRAFGIFRPVLRYAERVVSHDVALAELADRRAEVFSRLIPLTPARLGRRSRGQLLTAVVRDLDDVIDERVRVTVPGWSAVIASVIGALIAGWHLPAAGIVIAVGATLAGLLGFAGVALERAAQDDAVAARGTVQHLVTALTGRLLPVQAVTGLTADPAPLLTPIEEAERAQHRAEARLIATRAVVISLAWVVVAAASAVVITLAWRAHAAGELSGPYAALVALVPMALADTFVSVGEIAGARARARAALARLETVLGQPPAVHDPVGAQVRGGERHGIPSTPHLALEQVGAAWTADASQLDLFPLDLDLPAGSRVALTGPNGSGKSTALAVLARHLDPATGGYRMDDADARELPLEQVRARIAVVDDEPHAFAGSVRANLALAAPDASDEQMVEALGAVDLAHWFGTLPQGLDTPLTGLSGGERSRLSLARALLSGRPVVLLDEPTAHLDDATADRAIAGLMRAPGGTERTFVLVSHRPGDPDGWDIVDLEPAAVEVIGSRA